MRKIILCYVPVIHQGYINFFRKHKDAEEIIIFDAYELEDFPELRKDIRALTSVDVVPILMALNLPQKISLLTRLKLEEIIDISFADELHLIFPDDAINAAFEAKHRKKFSARHTEFIFDKVFLRWDKSNSISKKDISPDCQISSDLLDHALMARAVGISDRSSDFWRSVGAVLFSLDHDYLLDAHNQHVPSEYQPYFDGDPRGNFSKGLNIEISTALHAEASVIAMAARKGLVVEGASLYVTTFPCPPCAKLVAYSGVKKLFFKTGYAMLDAESILRANGIEIIQVI
jgi:dCMP deaminase